MLKVRQTYFNRCEYGSHLIEYIARDKNINTSLTDDDLFRLSDTDIGQAAAEWCETCNKKTMQTTVAYSLEEKS
jgi:hypothetical protein